MLRHRCLRGTLTSSALALALCSAATTSTRAHSREPDAQELRGLLAEGRVRAWVLFAAEE